MNPFGIVMLVASATLLSAQEVHREVAPGREFRDSKVLTPGQIDVWHIDAKADEVLRCRCTAKDLDPVLDLVDADGNVLLSDDGKGSQSYVRYRMPKAGKVSFRVRGFQGAGGGRYEVVVTRYVAPRIAVGGEATGKFGREQWSHVRLHLDKGERFLPIVTGGRVTLVQRFDNDQSLRATLSAYTAPESGEYHVRIEGRHQDAFRLATHGPTYRSVTLGQQVEVELRPWGLDIVRVDLPADTAVTFDVLMPGTQLKQWHRLLGEKPAWRKLITQSKGGKSRQMFWSKRGLSLELWLHNESGNPASYAFTPRFADAPVPTADGGGNLPLGGLCCHTLRVQVGEVVSLQLSSQSFDPSMRVCDPSGKSIGDVDDRGPLDRTASMTFHAQQAGNYRVLVFAGGGVGSGDYDLQVVRHEVPTLALGGHLDLPCDPSASAYAHLKLAAGQEVWLSVKSTKVDAALTLIDDQGKNHGTWERGGVGGDVLGAFRAKRACTLSLFVHSRSGSGSCRLRALAVE